MATSSATKPGRVPALLSILFALAGTATWIAVALTPFHDQVIPAHVWPVLEFFIGIGVVGLVVGVIAVIRGRILFRVAGVVGGLLSLALLVFGLVGVTILQMFPHGLLIGG